jgi:hypothetical protein
MELKAIAFHGLRLVTGSINRGCRFRASSFRIDAVRRRVTLAANPSLAAPLDNP